MHDRRNIFQSPHLGQLADHSALLLLGSFRILCVYQELARPSIICDAYRRKGPTWKLDMCRPMISANKKAH
jgi:hypothetical protein